MSGVIPPPSLLFRGTYGDIFTFIYRRVYVSYVSYIYTYMRTYSYTRTFERHNKAVRSTKTLRSY
jgi:hypothetical protein